MAKTADITPSQIKLTDNTTADVHTILANNGVLDIDKPVSVESLGGRSSKDFAISGISGYNVGLKSNVGAWLLQANNDTGIIAQPKQSCCRAYQTSAQTISASTETKLIFKGVSFDMQNEFDNTSNYRFTVKADSGKYEIFLCATWTTGLNANIAKLSIKLNGSPVAVCMREIHNNYAESMIIDDIESLVAGDYIEFYIYQNGSDSHDTVYGAYPTFCSVSKTS